MVAAVVVVLAAAVATVGSVPDFFDGVQGLGFGVVDACHQALINFFAKPGLAAGFNFERLVDEVFFAGHDVYHVPEAFGVMVGSVNVDMDSATAVHDGARFAEDSDQLLDVLDVIIVAFRGNNFNFVVVVGVTAVFVLRLDAAVAHYLPGAALTIGHMIFAVAAANVPGGCSEVVRYRIGRRATG